MLIGDANDKYEIVVTHDVCDHHEKHPEDKSWPGCTCSSSYTRKKVSNEDTINHKKEE